MASKSFLLFIKGDLDGPGSHGRIKGCQGSPNFSFTEIDRHRDSPGSYRRIKGSQGSPNFSFTEIDRHWDSHDYPFFFYKGES